MQCSLSIFQSEKNSFILLIHIILIINQLSKYVVLIICREIEEVRGLLSKDKIVDSLKSKTLLGRNMLNDCFLSIYKLIEGTEKGENSSKILLIFLLSENEYIRQVHSSVQEEVTVLR